MVGLPFFSVVVVSRYQPQSLNELDVVKTAHEAVLTVADATPESENAVTSKADFDCVSENAD
jgi:hypothetical protein